jgi:hypothetical protein
MIIYWTIAIILLMTLAGLIFYRVAGDRTRAWFRLRRRRPTLAIDANMGDPCCVAAPVAVYDASGESTGEAMACCLRFKVLNQGGGPAYNVRAYPIHIQMQTGNDRFSSVPGFSGVSFHWAGERDSLLCLPVLDSGRAVLCKLGHVVEPSPDGRRYGEAAAGQQPILIVDASLNETHMPGSLAALIQPNLTLAPGRYLIDVGVTSDNSEPISRKLDLVVEGRWGADGKAVAFVRLF